MTALLPWTETTAAGVSMTIELHIYPLDIVLRACHAFTDRCYVFPRDCDGDRVTIDFAPRDPQTSLRELAGEFSNELLEQQLRAAIGEETRAIRELLVAQAFCEADLLDRRDSESDEHADPRGIGR
jgi:His-Xaa-Ser system protein HxsD